MWRTSFNHNDDSYHIKCNQNQFLSIRIYYEPENLLSEEQMDALIHVDGLVQERRNFSALAMKLRLSCIKPSLWYLMMLVQFKVNDISKQSTILHLHVTS